MLKRKVVLQSPRILQRKRRHRRVIFFLVLFFIAGLALGFYFLVRQPFLNIKSVSVDGAQVTHQEDIGATAMAALAGYYGGVLPKTDIFFYPKKEVTLSLENSYPRIDTVSMSLEGNVLHISIKEKEPFALWCSDGAECYFLDTAGDIFARAPDFSEGVYKIYSGLIEGEPVGQIFLSEGDLSHIKEIYAAIESSGASINAVRVISYKEVRLESPSGAYFIIDLNQDSKMVAENSVSILASDEFKNLLPELSGVDYVDLRFGNKVFFKKGKSTATSTPPLTLKAVASPVLR